jgi:hypothetical protein
MYVYRSGSAADTQAVADYVKHYVDPHAIELGNIYVFVYIYICMCMYLYICLHICIN